MLKRFLRSGFVTGVAIGLALATPSYAARMMHLDDDPPTGGGGGGDDPLLEETPGGGGGGGGGSQAGGIGDYIAMRNEMQQTVFGDGTGFSFAYSMPTFPTAPGVIVVSNDYQMMTVEINELTALSADSNAAAAQAAAAERGITNLRCSVFTGSVLGVSGNRYPIDGVLSAWTMPDGSEVTRLVPISKNSLADTRERIDPFIRSSPRGIVQPGPLDNLRDYGPPTTPATCAALTDPTELCVCIAQLSFDNCAKAALDTKRICEQTAAWGVVAAVVACAGSALGFWTVVACYWVIAAAIAAASACYRSYYVAMKSCYDQFEIDLVPCGILIMHLR